MIDFAKCLFGDAEKRAVNKVMEGYWLASGKENEAFEKEFATYVGAKYAVAVNSGSSANLLAMAALNLPKGSKVITSGCGFPATLTPILHCGLEPVLVDYDLTTHNIDLNQIKDHGSTSKAAIVAHTLGNPVDMERLLKLGIPIIEDCCEAVGSKLKGKFLGTYGVMGTYSFYPSHQMTALGTGGMVVTSSKELALRLRSLRDWGKVSDWDSYLGDHPTKYDHNDYFKQYTYETVGYNMKLSEAAAAFGREQLKRLDGFTRGRKLNYSMLKHRLADLCEIFIDVVQTKDSEPSWFGYVLTFKSDKYNRNDFSDYLESRGIRTRPFFAGNITRHKPFKKYERTFPIADKLMKDSLFVGVHPGIAEGEITFMETTIRQYFK